ncbi:MAG: aldehyde dehydrogenase family protein, partial [Planctomycetota bacterium]
LDAAMRFAREVHSGEVHSGNVHVNQGPTWGAHLMPSGGLKDSGFGKEGPKYAIEEMAEMKTVVIHT